MRVRSVRTLWPTRALGSVQRVCIMISLFSCCFFRVSFSLLFPFCVWFIHCLSLSVQTARERFYRACFLPFDSSVLIFGEWLACANVRCSLWLMVIQLKKFIIILRWWNFFILGRRRERIYVTLHINTLTHTHTLCAYCVQWCSFLIPVSPLVSHISR